MFVRIQQKSPLNSHIFIFQSISSAEEVYILKLRIIKIKNINSNIFTGENITGNAIY